MLTKQTNKQTYKRAIVALQNRWWSKNLFTIMTSQNWGTKNFLFLFTMSCFMLCYKNERAKVALQKLRTKKKTIKFSPCCAWFFLVIHVHLCTTKVVVGYKALRQGYKVLLGQRVILNPPPRGNISKCLGRKFWGRPCMKGEALLRCKHVNA